MSKPIHVKKGGGKAVRLGPDVWTIKAGGGDTGGQFDLLEATVSYMQGPPLHTHEKQFDTFYVIDGVLTVQVGDEVIDLGPGEMASAPPGVPHTYSNRHKQPARVINLVTPGGFDRALTEMASFGAGPPDEAKMAAFCKQHGVAIVGPPLAVRLGLR